MTTEIQKRINNISDNKNLSVETPIQTAKIELTGICTLGCEFCYNKELKKQKARQKLMSDFEFGVVLNYIKKIPTLKEVGLFYMGESGLHPKLPEYYKKVKEIGYFTYLTTNGTTIKNILPAIKYIDSLKVSWNYKNEKDFVKKTKAPAKEYKLIKSNIYELYKECEKQGKKLALSTILDSKKEDYEKVVLELPHHEHYYIPLQTQGGTTKKGLGGVVGESENMSTQLPCWSLFKGLYIDCDLNIRTCCYGHKDEHILGRIPDNTKALRDDFKQQHLNKIIPGICKSCIKAKDMEVM